MATKSAVLNSNGLHETLAANAHVPEPAEAPKPSGASLPVFSNWEWDDSAEKAAKRGLPLPDICHELDQLTGGWPRRVEKTLFVPGANHEPRYLETHSQLFAWLDTKAFIDWGRSSDMVSQERILAHLQETAQQYES